MSYNKNWIDAINIKANSARLKNNNLISEEQLNQINATYKEEFYSPNMFVRIGLFIFTFILANSALGILGTIIAVSITNEIVFGVLCLIGSAILLFSLQFFIKNKNHYRSGIDDCLLYLAVSFIVFGILLFTDFSNTKFIVFICVPLLAFASFRYMDSLLAFLAFVCFHVWIFLVAADFELGKAFMPFIFLLSSLCVAFISHKLLRNDRFVYWKHIFKVLKVVALLMVYLSMNYFVVREGNILLSETSVDMSTNKEYEAVQKSINSNQEFINSSYSDTLHTLSDEEMTRLSNENEELYTKLYAIERDELSKARSGGLPMSFIFIICTLLFPIIYIILGLRSKDRLFLVTGLIILVGTVATYQFYTPDFPYEYTITLGGLLMLVVAWSSIRFLKTNNRVFTFEQDSDKENQGLLNAEAFMVSQTTGHMSPDGNQGSEFGGGSFGGGGAGGKY